MAHVLGYPRIPASAGMTEERDPAHLQKLGAILEQRLGSNPRLEVGAAGGEATAPVEEPPPAAPMERRAPEPPPASQEASPQTGSPNGSAGPDTRNRAPEPTGEDDVIHDEREVFEIAREHEKN